MPIISREDISGVAVLTWDQPDSNVNVKNREALKEFAAAVDAALADEAVKGIVLTSAKTDFVVGGDLGELQAAKTSDEARRLVAGVRDTLRKIERGGKPVVAALNGKVLGGGLELALACHARIAEDKATFGLPEVTLGLMPGAGGTQRLPRLIGPKSALSLLTDGHPMSATQAQEIGLVRKIVSRDALVDAAVALVAETCPTQPWDAGGDITRTDSREVFDIVRAACARRSGEGDRAEATIIETVEKGSALDFDAALDLEAVRFGELVVSSTAKNRIRTMFFAMNEAKAMKRRPSDEPPYALSTIAVVGAGTMGGGIAFTAASAGLKVRLIEVDREALDRGMGMIKRIGDRQVKAGRMDEARKADVLQRIRPTLSYDDLADVDLAIEAVIEVEKIKAVVLSNLSKAIRPGAPIASNTSTLPISTLARYCDRPEEFVGLHFFGPVERMPLVEVIRGEKTEDAIVARSLDLLKAMRKTPIVVKDGLGFYTSRVVAAYTGEAMTLVAEGVDPQVIDKAATDFGMVIGPCLMNDMTGLPLLLDIFASVGSDPTRPANRGNRSVEALEKLVAAGRTGRRDGKGIYDYDDKGPKPWHGIRDVFPPPANPLSQEDIKKRLMYGQAIEAGRSLEEGVVCDPGDADIGSVLGWMFPKWTGGVLSYIDTVGTARFAAECEDLAARFGERFEPPTSLKRMAETDTRYHAL